MDILDTILTMPRAELRAAIEETCDIVVDVAGRAETDDALRDRLIAAFLEAGHAGFNQATESVQAAAIVIVAVSLASRSRQHQ